MVDPVKHERSNLTIQTNLVDREENQYRLQLLAQAVEKVESESSQKKRCSTVAPKLCNKNDSFSKEALKMSSTFPTSQSQEFFMQLLGQQNVAAVMAAAAAAAAQLQLQKQKPEPISPPSTSSGSSSVESPIDFSSRRSTDENGTDCSSPSSPNGQLLSNMLQNFQSTNSLTNPNFPLLLTNKNGKPTRPFKAYPRDPLMLPIGFCSTTSEQNNLLSEAVMRTTPNRKRLGTPHDRQKQQQTPPSTMTNTHFISSTGTQILQPPKKRHRPVENSDLQQDEQNSNKEINQDSNSLVKDDAYWERRRKNNEAAKRSRDARRIKEDEIAIRAALLEQENLKLRLELSQLKQETAKLRCMIQTNS